MTDERIERVRVRHGNWSHHEGYPCDECRIDSLERQLTELREALTLSRAVERGTNKAYEEARGRIEDLEFERGLREPRLAVAREVVEAARCVVAGRPDWVDAGGDWAQLVAALAHHDEVTA